MPVTDVLAPSPNTSGNQSNDRDESSIISDDYEMFRDLFPERKPTILQVLPALGTGGVERGTIEVAGAIKAAGWNAIVVSSGGPLERQLERVDALHFTLPVHSKNPLRWGRTARALADIAKKHNVDILHARSRVPGWICSKVTKLTGIPFMTTFHGRYGDSNPFKRIYNSIMVSGERVIAISYYIADVIMQRYKINPANLRIIQRGVDLDLFDPEKVSAERMIKLANEWRLPDDKPVVMLPGRVTRWKGHHTLLDALATLTDVAPRCLIVGPYAGKETYKAELDAKVKQLGLEALVHFVGDCQDMPAAYKVADVVVNASVDPEPFGRTIVEAQAMGRPVVANDHGGARETVIPAETGWLVKPNDVVAMARALRTALTLSEERRAEVAENCIKNARDNFSRQAMCARTLSVYAELLGAMPAPE